MEKDILKLIYEFPIMIAGINQQKSIIIFSEQCEKLFEYTKEEMFANSNGIDVLLPPHSGHQSTLFEIMQLKPDRPYVVNDLSVQTKTGKNIVVNWHIRNRKHPLIDADITWLIGYDVTEEAIIRKNLRASEKRFQTICTATNDAVWDWDLTTNALWWNDGMRDIFGYQNNQREHTIEWWVSNIHPEDRDRVKKRIYESVDRADDYWFDEYRFRRNDDSYAYVFDKGFIIKNEAGKAAQMIGGMMDITDKKIFQENLTLKTTQLREYSYYNSHKFRGPLARLMSLAHVLDIDEESTESNKLVAKQIQVAAEELDRLVRELSKLLQ